MGTGIAIFMHYDDVMVSSWFAFEFARSLL